MLACSSRCEPATPYQLKQIAQVSIFHFWSVPHTQIYTECARLAEAGLLDEEREETGRRRRTYRLTPDGRKALEDWRADPETDMYELRDPGLLKLFCGADPTSLARTQLEAHERRLAEYEGMHGWDGMPEGMRLALEGGIGHSASTCASGAACLRRPPSERPPSESAAELAGADRRGDERHAGPVDEVGVGRGVEDRPRQRARRAPAGRRRRGAAPARRPVWPPTAPPRWSSACSRTASAMQKLIEVVLLEPGLVLVAIATETPASITRRASG